MSTSSRPRIPIFVFVVATVLATAAAALVLVIASGDDVDERTQGERIKLDQDALLVPDDTPNEQHAEGLLVDFTTYDDGSGTLADFVGTPMVVNFFSSECVPCITEMPEFEEVSQQFGDDVTFVGLAVLDRKSAELELIEQTGVTYFTARDTRGEIASAVGSIGMPTTLFIDADGQIVDRHTGRLTKSDLIDTIESKLLV